MDILYSLRSTHRGYVLSNSIVPVRHVHQEQGFSEFSFLHVTLLVQIWRAMLQHKAVSNVHIWDLLYFMTPIQPQ